MSYAEASYFNKRDSPAFYAEFRIWQTGQTAVTSFEIIGYDPDRLLPANGAEAADAVTLIQQEEAAQANDVQGLSMDGAGYNGPVLRELTDPEGLNLDVTVPPPSPPERPTFGPERFALQVRDNGTRVVGLPQRPNQPSTAT